MSKCGINTTSIVSTSMEVEFLGDLSEFSEFIDLPECSKVTVGDVMMGLLKEVKRQREAIEISEMPSCITAGKDTTIAQVVMAVGQKVCK